MDNTIPVTIANQMGGANRIGIMIGATLIYTPRTLRIKWKARSRFNFCEVVLRSDDTYSVHFSKVDRMGAASAKESHDGIYCDMLKPLFEKETGLYLSF